MLLEAVHLSFAYRPGRAILADISLSLQPGAITAIVGPNGAGKSTLMRLFLGILEPSSGQVLLDGLSVRSIPHRLRARRMAYVPQRPSIAFAFTVREYVLLGRYSAPAHALDGLARDALSRVELAERADDPFPILSVGQQQRAALARALLQIRPPHAAPPILLADEPVSAMDPRHALQTMAILRGLASAGAAVAVVLHDLTLALRFCDRAAVLDGSGHLAATGHASETLTPAILDPVFGVQFHALADAAGPAALVPIPSDPDH